jgi:hypothetical protein
MFSSSSYEILHPKYMKTLGVDGRIIVEWMIGNRMGGYGLDASHSG